MKMSKKAKKYVGMAILLAAAVGCGVYFLPKVFYNFTHVSTDDAYVEGTIVPIAPQVSGKVINVYAERNQLVKKGQILFEIDPTDYVQEVEDTKNAYEASVVQLEDIKVAIQGKEAEIEKAHQDLLATQAKYEYAQKQRDRYYNLLKENVISQDEYDNVEAAFKVNQANVAAQIANIKKLELDLKDLQTQLIKQQHLIEQAEAKYELARINLDRTKIYAPIDGYVAKRNVEVGQHAQAGAPLLNIVDLTHVWVTANFEETSINKIRVGAKVAIKVDAYPGRTFYGYVHSFQSGSGAVFSLLPPENAVGNFIKVVQRIPVKIDLTSPYDPNTPLYPGLSVVPYVSVK